MEFLKNNFNRRLIGSTVILILGVILTVGALTNPGPDKLAIDALPGLFIIIGALLYRSAKKRKIGLVKDIKIRRILEILVLVLLVALYLKTQQIMQLLEDADMTSSIILFLVIISYLIAVGRRRDVSPIPLRSEAKPTYQEKYEPHGESKPNK